MLVLLFRVLLIVFLLWVVWQLVREACSSFEAPGFRPHWLARFLGLSDGHGSQS